MCKNRLRILLVDDDYLLAKGTAKLIERLGGHRVAITDKPDEIFSQCQSKAVDIVLMDVNLPEAVWEGQEVSGADLSKIIKNHPDMADVPIILISAYAMVSERDKLMDISQADDFWPKPISDYEALLFAIERQVNKYQQKS